MPHQIEVWTDGSNLRNGQEDSTGGCCAIVCIDGKVEAELAQVLERTTNNQAELEGIKLGLSYLIERGLENEEVQVVTDSSYCEGLLSYDDGRWRFNASKNRLLVSRIRDIVRKFSSFSIRRVKGHRKENVLNCRADHLAKAVYSPKGV